MLIQLNTKRLRTLKGAATRSDFHWNNLNQA